MLPNIVSRLPKVRGRITLYECNFGYLGRSRQCTGLRARKGECRFGVPPPSLDSCSKRGEPSTNLDHAASPLGPRSAAGALSASPQGKGTVIVYVDNPKVGENIGAHFNFAPSELPVAVEKASEANML